MSKRIAQLPLASRLFPADLIPISQGGVTKGISAALFQPTLYAQWFGTNFDNGITDNTVPLQAAIDAAEAVNGRLNLPPGSGMVTDQLNIDASIHLLGISTGADAGTQIFTTANKPILNITARCVVQDLALKGTNNIAYTQQDLVRITSTNDVKLQRLFLNIGYNNIRVVGTCFFLTFEGIVFYDAANAELLTEGTTDQGCEIEMYHCRVEGGAQPCNYGFLFDNLGALMIVGLNFTHSNIQVAGMKVNTIALLYGGILMTGATIEIEGPPGVGPALWLQGTALRPIRKVTCTSCQLGGSNVVGNPIVILAYVTLSKFAQLLIYGPGRGIRFVNSVTRCRFRDIDYEGGDYQFIADAAGTEVGDLEFQGTTADTTTVSTFYFHSGTPLTLGNIRIRNCELGNLADFANVIDRPAFSSGKIFTVDCAGYNKGPLTAPAIAATTVQVQNRFDVPVTVYVNGTITGSAVNNVSTNCAEKVIRIPVNGTIALNYSGAAPTWKWVGE